MSDVPTRMLRDALRRPMEAHTDGCLDAATLAAWSDEALTADERVAVERHASSCARCQALLAAMARIETASTTTTSSLERRRWRIPAFGWIAPLAAAAALVLWVAVTSPRRALSVNLPAQPTAAPQQVAPATPQDAPASSAKPAEAPSSPSARPEPLERDTARKEVTTRENRARADDRLAAVPPSPPKPVAQPQSADATEPVAAAPPAAPTPAATPQSAPALAGAASSRFRSEALMAKAAPTTTTAIASPDPNVRWRITGDGAVERTEDGGASWQRQSTGVTVNLTAGSAPSRDVCWLVGSAGVVVVSTDGLTWSRVPFPETINLASIQASDISNATVTSTDGRAFTTHDGGRTWQRP